ncbi:MAG: hypothetical protein ACT4P8_18875 [Betaproteobacteria bacterium]
MRRTVVIGEFATEPEAARAVDRLLRACISGEHVRAFFLNHGEPPRRKPARRIEPPRLHPASGSVGRSAAIALDLGPSTAADGVGVSVYTRDVPPRGAAADADPCRARILISVETQDHVAQALATNVLRQHGALDVERLRAPRASRAGFHPVSLSSLLERCKPELAPAEPVAATHH